MLGVNMGFGFGANDMWELGEKSIQSHCEYRGRKLTRFNNSKLLYLGVIRSAYVDDKKTKNKKCLIPPLFAALYCGAVLGLLFMVTSPWV